MFWGAIITIITYSLKYYIHLFCFCFFLSEILQICTSGVNYTSNLNIVKINLKLKSVWRKIKNNKKNTTLKQ